MVSDGTRSGQRRARGIARSPLEPGPLKDLKDAIYDLYVRAERPTLDEISADLMALADDLDLPALPRRDTIDRVIGDGRLPPRQQDAVAVAVVLAHAGGLEAAPVAEHVRALWVRAAGKLPTVTRLGRPVSRCDPLALEVHPAIRDEQRSLPVLPPYVVRLHDTELSKVVDEAAAGRSRIAMLVGGPSTGKTRTCWEAIQRLTEGWYVWHPFDPTRPAAAESSLAQVPAHTVVWFNEAQYYLLTADPELGERVAAGLRTLLLDPARAPVLVLGTIWPEHWDTLTGPPPPHDLDLHGQARNLLVGSDIAVPATWSPTDLRALAHAARTDPRLREAADQVEAAGRITQYLAGVPELMQRYRNAPPVARAVITAAIDARRLGHPFGLPRDLLARMAPEYLADVEWAQAGDNWLDEALAYAARPCHGTAGPLTRIRTRPTHGDAAAQVTWRLADYLERRGAVERASVLPPGGFWEAVGSSVDDPATLRTVADNAARRGRFLRAAPLYRRAGEGGDVDALWSLAELRERAGDLHGADVAGRRAAHLAGLGQRVPPTAPLQEVDDFWHIVDAERSAPETDYGSDNPAQAIPRNGESREEVARKAADYGDAMALPALAELQEREGDVHGAIDLYRQAADRGDPESTNKLILLLEQTGDGDGALQAALDAADNGRAAGLWTLILVRERSGEPSSAETVAMVAAERGDVAMLGSLASMRERLGSLDEAERMYQEAADRGDPYALWSLAGLRERSGDHEGAETLYLQCVNRGTPSGLASLAALREQMGDAAAAERLYRRAVDRGSLSAMLALDRISIGVVEGHHHSLYECE